MEAGSSNLTLMIALMNLEADGGLPGKSDESRWVRTAVLALWALQEMSAQQTSRYQLHLAKMANFLWDNRSFCPDTGETKQHKLVSFLRSGISLVPGDWEKVFQKTAGVDQIWNDILGQIALV